MDIDEMLDGLCWPVTVCEPRACCCDTTMKLCELFALFPANKPSKLCHVCLVTAVQDDVRGIGGALQQGEP